MASGQIGRRSIGKSFGLSFGRLGSAGCVSSVRPTPAAIRRCPTRRPSPQEVATPLPSDPAAARATGPTADPAGQLACCLTACAFDPTPDLVRLNRQGEVDARGPVPAHHGLRLQVSFWRFASRPRRWSRCGSSQPTAPKEQARLFFAIKV